MNKSTKTIMTIITVLIMLICSYLLGTTQAHTVTITETQVHTVTEIKEIIPDGYISTDSLEFYENYIDMRRVTEFVATDTGLQLYLNDGTGYYWESTEER